jgi:outer membrane protein OmpA-like peptidoglycan-associated protein
MLNVGGPGLGWRRAFLAAMVTFAPVGEAASATDCQAMLELAVNAGEERNLPALRDVHDRASAARCVVDDGAALADLLAVQLGALEYAQLRSANLGSPQARDDAIVRLRRVVDTPGGLQWQALELFADLLSQRGKHAEAAARYQQLLDLIADERLTPQAPPVTSIRAIWRKGEQARLLAREFVGTATRNDRPSGFGAGAVRSFVPEARALPIEFEFDSTELTALGRAYLEDLADYLRRLPAEQAVHLTGHTDELGPDAYNEALSLRRANAVRTGLREKGVAQRITVSGQGKRRPLQIVNQATFNYSVDQVNQMNRRVELREEQ